jgi:hypothetical protein
LASTALMRKSSSAHPAAKMCRSSAVLRCVKASANTWDWIVIYYGLLYILYILTTWWCCMCRKKPSLCVFEVFAPRDRSAAKEKRERERGRERQTDRERQRKR